MLDKHFDPQAIENKWYKTWEETGLFAADTSSDKSPYCIMIPPPNVTGSLHMGHAFQDTIMDTLIRLNRMRGHPTLWQPGTDHAGIATQMVVERRLAQEGKSRHDLGRDKFIEEVWKWKEESGGTITQQLRRMGASPDWSRERFTMDEGLSNAVKEVFVRLYDEGLIYRGKRLVNWDPVLHTAVSDLEVNSAEENGSMWHMRYPLADGSGSLVVATTRPETMLGDQAVAVNPEDDRYQHLIGKLVKLPLTDREIPVIADDYVDQDFGTGCVKITPAHDFNDHEIGKRHNLEMLNIFTPDATLNENAPEKYQGMNRFDARKQIVKDLEELGLLEKIEPHTLMVPRGDRSQAVIEPLLTDQWFVAVESLAKPAIEAVKSGQIEFVPKNWENTYFEWMNNIQDWCISRQIWWGHRIPAWYDAEGNIFVGRDEAEVRAKHNLAADYQLNQDNDVLDTWFSSALWTFSTLGWPEETPELKMFHPTSVLVTGFDIIFFWVARMIMMGLKFTGEVPFKQVFVHGLVRDSQGNKMSKSRGNVLDPLDLIDGIDLESLVEKRTTGLMQPEMAERIEKETRKEFPEGIPSFGTDALRFTFASLASTGRDVRFDLNRCEGYRNFCNKLWNATRFVLMNTQGEDTGLDDTAELEFSQADKWIISRLQKVEAEVNRHFDNYRFDLAANQLYEFTWNEYCDWYLELTKPIFTKDSSDAAKRATRRTLVRVLETLLRLLHPVMPFITEEAWQTVAPLAGVTGDSIMTHPYPQADDSKLDANAEAEIEWVKAFIMGVRRIRSEMDIAPSRRLEILLDKVSQQDLAYLEANKTSLLFLARLEEISILETGATAPEAAVALVGEMNILIPMAGLIDKEAELARLTKEIEKLKKDAERINNKLGNAGFTDKAPAEVVEKEKAKLQEITQALTNLEQQHAKIQQI